MNTFDSPLLEVAEKFRETLVHSTGRAFFVSPHFPNGPRLTGRFEVRNSLGEVKRLQDAALTLPLPLFHMASHVGWPTELVRLETSQLGRITIWPLSLLLELQVGCRWHGFSGKPIASWPESLVAFAECEGDPVALRSNEDDGPVILAHRCDEGLCDGKTLSENLAKFLLFLSEEISCGAPVTLFPAKDFF